MQVNNIYSNDKQPFNARLKIKDIQGVLEKSDINYLRSKASKIGTKDDFIKVELHIYEPATSSPWARRGLLGCFLIKKRI